MPSLYELNKDYKELQAMLEVAETEEDMQAIQDTLDMLDCSIDEKSKILQCLSETLKAIFKHLRMRQTAKC